MWKYALSAILFASFAHAGANDKMRFLTMNVWLNGSAVENGFDKLVHQLERSRADVIFLQEADLVTPRLAKKMRLSYIVKSNERGTGPAVLSRYPFIKTVSLGNSVGALIEMRGRKVAVLSVHLDAWPEDKFPYGPYWACFGGKSSAEILEMEKRTRGREMHDDIHELALQFPEADDIILGGDFNSPSHLDWTEKNKGQHCGHVIKFPATKTLQDAGFTDAYRALNPDPLIARGDTWSPVNPTNHDHGDKPEPQDRLDMIHFKGKLELLRVEVFEDTKANWPSDHRALIADLEFAKPTQIQTTRLK